MELGVDLAAFMFPGGEESTVAFAGSKLISRKSQDTDVSIHMNPRSITSYLSLFVSSARDSGIRLIEKQEALSE